jgi:hypothetical protein
MLKRILLIFIALAPFSLFGAGKSKAPHIGYAYPPGVRQGSDNLIIIGGMNLRGIQKATITGDGITVESIKPFLPFKRLSNDLKRELIPILKAIDEGKDPIAESKKNSEKLINKLKKQKRHEEEKRRKAAIEAEKNGKPIKKSTAAQKNLDYEKELEIIPGERLIYIDKTPEEVVKIIKNLSPLEYEVLLKKVFSRRNALQVAPAIEQIAIMKLKVAPNAKNGFRELRVISREGVSNQIPFVIGSLPEITTKTFRMNKKNPPQDLKLEMITNGQIMPGEVDKYHFKAQAGKNYSFELQGRSLVPYLSDAVPGWFQPIMSIHDKKGKLVAFADDNLFHPDPIISFKAPESVEYELRIRDSIYRGREDFVYRLKAKIGHPEQIKTKTSNFKSELPKKTESEPNNSVKTPQWIIYPTLLAGKINKPGDVDIYSFTGKKGDKIVAEIFARRLDSPMDSLIKITNAEGKTLVWNDDYEWLNLGTKTHHADSYLLYELPVDGTYSIKVADTQAKGGKGFKYLLRVDTPKPDFQVFMTPSVINTRSLISSPITLEVFRKDGFNGPIDILLKKGPKGAKISGGKIPEGVKKIQITISTPRKIKPELYDITLVAKADINGKTIFHNVVPTDEIMQAFLYTHLIPTEKTVLNIVKKGWLPVKAIMPKNVTTIAPGEKIEFKLQDYLYWENLKKRKKKIEIQKINFELRSPPKGLKLTEIGYKDKHHLMTLEAAPDIKPWTGNLIIECSAKGTWRNNGNSGIYNYVIGALPAIPLKVLQK